MKASGDRLPKTLEMYPGKQALGRCGGVYSWRGYQELCSLLAVFAGHQSSAVRVPCHVQGGTAAAFLRRAALLLVRVAFKDCIV